MSFRLNEHPFAVEAHFDRSLVLTFAVPAEDLQALIPECLSPDTFNEVWGFIAVAVVQTRRLRPKGLPEVLGSDFLLIGYRVFVRYVDLSGRRLRGLYILKSETDSKRMEWLGSLFTRYNYTTTDITQQRTTDGWKVYSAQSGLNLDVTAEQPVILPPGSPFTDWKQARRFAGPLPFTFSYDSVEKSVLIVEGVREHWQPLPVGVRNFEIPYLKTLHLKQCTLASAFMVEQISYYWKKGRVEQWKG